MNKYIGSFSEGYSAPLRALMPEKRESFTAQSIIQKANQTALRAQKTMDKAFREFVMTNGRKSNLPEVLQNLTETEKAKLLEELIREKTSEIQTNN